MESAEKKTASNNNRLWLIILGVLGALIVGLVIAIVVVKSVPRNVENVEPGPINVAYDAYEDARREIVNSILENGLDNTSRLNLYQKYIDEAQDEKTKAYLMNDYYDELMVQDIEMVMGEEIVNGLIEVDKILGDASSAMAVWSAAEYYGMDDMATQYKSISEERLGGDVKLEYPE